MADEGYYRPFLNRDRLVHILDPDPATCEALSVLFRLEGFQTAFDRHRRLLRRPGAAPSDAVVLNQRIGDADGLSVLRRQSMRMGTPVFLLEDEPRSAPR